MDFKRVSLDYKCQFALVSAQNYFAILKSLIMNKKDYHNLTMIIISFKHT